MNKKKIIIKLAIFIALSSSIAMFGNALNVGMTNDLAMLQMQNTNTSIITNQMFNKMGVVSPILIICFGLIIFKREIKILLKRGK